MGRVKYDLIKKLMKGRFKTVFLCENSWSLRGEKNKYFR
jgi:hypothetical protein